MNEKVNRKKRKGISYAKWGYIFILPFFIAYISFTLIPQLMTFYNSFFENYMNGLKQVNDNFGHDAGDQVIIGAAECLDGFEGTEMKSELAY